jgi:hypothetical protein|tara:strand:- start:26 stop:334 length:309 start_codon:yes stop_codon:yes gene_type:complete
LSHKQTFREALSPTATRVIIADGDDLHVGVEVDGDAMRDTASLLREMNDAAPLHTDLRLAAIIPQDVVERSFTEGWFHDRAAWKAWANDPQHRDLRVWGGEL